MRVSRCRASAGVQTVCRQSRGKLWRNAAGKVAARLATARQNSQTNHSGRAHISHTKRSPKANLRSVLEEMSLIEQISAIDRANQWSLPHASQQTEFSRFTSGQTREPRQKLRKSRPTGPWVAHRSTTPYVTRSRVAPRSALSRPAAHPPTKMRSGDKPGVLIEVRGEYAVRSTPWLLALDQEDSGIAALRCHDSDSRRSFLQVAPPVDSLNIVRMIVSPGSSHAPRMNMIRYYVAVIRKFDTSESLSGWTTTGYSMAING